MCESHTHGNTGPQTNVNNLTNTEHLEGGNKNLTSALSNYTEKFLSNKSQLAHFNKLHNAAAKLTYINGLITEHYAQLMTAAGTNAKEVQRLQSEMTGYIQMASNDIFGGSTPPAKA